MSETKIPYKIYLEENEMPKAWYNVRADMKKKPEPLLDPETHEVMSVEQLSEVFCKELVEQELDDTTAYFPIPEEIQNFY
jgi:tryptophan synthase beta chain